MSFQLNFAMKRPAAKLIAAGILIATMHCRKGNKKLNETKPWPAGVQYHTISTISFYVLQPRHEWNHALQTGASSPCKWQLPEPKSYDGEKARYTINHSILSDLTIYVNAKEFTKNIWSNDRLPYRAGRSSSVD
jgi:hypothetical protein